ncbi:MAG TPA: pyridoxal 5'-phosphate synthase glutaminase subunit PdxT [Candidatus Bilamarchaeum sp.]|nr:pyridoxal 5'-phosphate synthase glutaminase subunit PdxT [Candidatus Bilamarchaeum sp.]
MRIGVLAFHGDVIEHVRAAEAAASGLSLECAVCEVRTKEGLGNLDGLIIPGGESTNFYKLIQREGMLEGIRKIRCIFGTCAGAIMLAKSIHNIEEGQKTLALMDIEIDRNAYGRQSESFEDDIDTKLGKIHAVFIRAPRIRSVGEGVSILAERNGEAVACEQETAGGYYLAACFHPELTTTKFHAHFLKKARPS